RRKTNPDNGADARVDRTTAGVARKHLDSRRNTTPQSPPEYEATRWRSLIVSPRENEKHYQIRYKPPHHEAVSPTKLANKIILFAPYQKILLGCERGASLGWNNTLDIE
ncbi:hypothetical protein A2U01_0019776, partial [Trifolium medium]|nr:hypothetical protein [Trifolium medium]